MQATCGHCGAKYALDDKKVAQHARVQFRCAKCGQMTVVSVAPPPIETQNVSALPDFARSGKSHSGGSTTMISQYQGLALPTNKSITVSIISGPSKGLVHPMTKPRVVLGRTGADIEINDPEVSRWHCAVEVKEEIVKLRDLDSTNGVFIDDERVRAAELSHLSEFRIGSSVVLITITPKSE